MGLLRRTLGPGYRLVRRTARLVRYGTLPALPAPQAGPVLSREEGRFLHMLMSRDRGYARAKGQVPSPIVAALQARQLVTWQRDGDGYAIAMTALGYEVAQRPGPGAHAERGRVG